MSDTGDPFFEAMAAADKRPPRPPGHGDESEFTLIKKVLTASGLDYTASERVRVACRNECGARIPSLTWFCTHTPRLPLFLGYRQVPYMKDALTDLIKKFSKTPCFEAWLSVCESLPLEFAGSDEDVPVGCAFRWPGWGDCIIHNMSTDLPTEGSYFVHHHRDRRYTIEPVAGLLARLDLEWVKAEWEVTF